MIALGTLPGLRIGDLAERTGTTAPTIRYYESIALIPPADRQGGGQRRYSASDVERLTFIRRCRDFGFSVEQVKRLVGLVVDPTRNCIEARDLAHGHLETIRAKISELRALEREMVTFADQCDTLCAGGPGSQCVPLTRLTAADRKGRQKARPAGRTRR